MFKIIIPAILLVFATSAFAFNENDYVHKPSNIDEAIEASEDGYIPCTRLLEDFDKAYNYMANTINMVGDGKVSPAQPIGNESVRSWDELKFYSEREFDECITEYNDEINAEKEAQAQKEAEEKAEKEAEEKAIADRIASVSKALEECDYDFFENQMTTKEKMDTYDERQACEQVEQTAFAPTSLPQVVTPVVVEPVVPAYTPPAQIQTAPVVADLAPEQEIIEQKVSTSTEATTTPETIEVTQEELDQMVEERLHERLEEESEPLAEPEEKPSFFKRVTNFLFGWMFKN